MPVPVRDTPLGRELFEEGRREGRQEGRQKGHEAGSREAAERMVAAWLRQRFGDDPQIERLAAALAELPDDDRIEKINAATSLKDLADG